MPFLVILLVQLVVMQASSLSFEFDVRIMTLSDYNNPITYAYKNVNETSAGLLDAFKQLTKADSEAFRVSESNLTADIISFGEQDIASYRDQCIVAAKFQVRCQDGGTRL